MKYLRNFETAEEGNSFIENFDGNYGVLMSCNEFPGVPYIIQGNGGLEIYVTTTQRYCSGSVFTPRSTLRDIYNYLYNNHYFDGDGGALYEVYYNNERIANYSGTSENWDKSLSELEISSGVLEYRGVLL